MHCLDNSETRKYKIFCYFFTTNYMKQIFLHILLCKIAQAQSDWWRLHVDTSFVTVSLLNRVWNVLFLYINLHWAKISIKVLYLLYFLYLLVLFSAPPTVLFHQLWPAALLLLHKKRPQVMMLPSLCFILGLLFSGKCILLAFCQKNSLTSAKKFNFILVVPEHYPLYG